MSIGSVSSVGSYNFMDRLVMNAMNRTDKSSQKKPPNAAEIIQKDDQDGDGLLSAAETKFDSKMFALLDSDSDGKLNTDELTTGFQNTTMRPMGPPPQGGAKPPPAMDVSKLAADVLQSADSDSDGVLSLEESGLESEAFSVLDTNGDGKVDAEELQAGLVARQAEMKQNNQAMPEKSAVAASGRSELYQSVLEILSRNSASSAYAETGWRAAMQPASASNLALDA